MSKRMYYLNTGYLFSLSLIAPTFIFLVLGIYLSMRFFSQHPYARDRVSIFLSLSMLCFSISIFFLLTLTDCFSWETLVFSVVLAGILTLLVKFDAFLRRKTAMHLKKGNKINTFLDIIADSHKKTHSENSDSNTQHEE